MKHIFYFSYETEDLKPISLHASTIVLWLRSKGVLSFSLSLSHRKKKSYNSEIFEVCIYACTLTNLQILISDVLIPNLSLIPSQGSPEHIIFLNNYEIWITLKKKCFTQSRPHLSKSRRERIFKWIFGYSWEMDGFIQNES